MRQEWEKIISHYRVPSITRADVVSVGEQNIDGEVTVTVKFSLEQATKTQRGSRGIVLLFL
jgi:hypothetical protein